MRTYEETPKLKEQDSDTEITLGMKSILGIFFGLALICGVFFGFGYSLGRGNTVKPTLPAATTPQPAAASPVKTVVEGNDTPNPGKPSAESAVVVQQPTAAATGTLIPAVQAQPEGAKAVPAVNAAPTAASLPGSSIARPANVAMSAPNSAASANVMVQIAAVSRRDDANVLVGALRKLGYSAIARTEPGDSLLHVQIGPFATRDDAKTVRARLLSDGYNAIIK